MDLIQLNYIFYSSDNFNTILASSASPFQLKITYCDVSSNSIINFPPFSDISSTISLSLIFFTLPSFHKLRMISGQLNQNSHFSAILNATPR